MLKHGIISFIFIFLVATCVLNAKISYELQSIEGTLNTLEYFNARYINENNEVSGYWHGQNKSGFFTYSQDNGMKKIEGLDGSNSWIFGFNELGQVLGTWKGGKIFKWDPQRGFIDVNDIVYGCNGQPIRLYDNGWALLILSSATTNMRTTSLWNGTDIIHFDASHRLWSQIEEKGFAVHELFVQHYIHDDLLAGCFTEGKANRLTGKMVPVNQHQFVIANGELYILTNSIHHGSVVDISTSGTILWITTDGVQGLEEIAYDNLWTKITDNQLNLVAEVSGFLGHKMTSAGLVLGTRWDENRKQKIPSLWNILTGEVMDIESTLTKPLAPSYDDNYGWESFEIADINDRGVFTGNGRIWTKFYPFYGIPKNN